MSLSTMPPSGLTLHGFAAGPEEPEHSPAILFKLSEDLLEDVKKAPKAQGGLHFLTGSTPKIRLGNRTIDLTISNEAFQHELYSASTDALGDFDFAGILGHRAELKVPERKQSLGGDAALAALQNTMAAFAQEKEAKKVNIHKQLVKEPRNRWEAAKSARRKGGIGLQADDSPGPSAGHRREISTTSIPATESAARTKAMRTPLIHLLAMRSVSTKDIVQKTHIPGYEVEEVLQKLGKQEAGGWKLIDRAYKELDVWKFGYSTQEDRQAAIDNAIRAYDRLRLGKDDNLWQMLLPKEERDKGIVLSKLHLAPAPPSRVLTPNPAGSGDEGIDGKSTAGTPRIGPAGTPKIGPGKNDKAGLSQRLLSKDPKKMQKMRAAEEAKEKKRKEREAAATNSDREGGKPARKKQMTKTTNPKVKSEEIVRDSSEEGSDGEQMSKTSAGSSSQPKTTTNGGSIKSPAVNAPAKTSAKNTPKLKEQKDAIANARPKTTAGATPKTAGTPSSRPSTIAASKTSRPAALGGKSTPNGLSAPSSQSRSQLSPQKGGSRPTIPSPLGAARPRVASDVSDRGAVGIQRPRPGGDTPKGLGITNGVRKRHDTVTSTDSSASRNSQKMNGEHSSINGHKSTPNGTTTAKHSSINGVDRSLKRKSADSPSHSQEDGRSTKHRKTESTSSQSQKSQASSVGAASSTDLRLHRSNSSDSTSSVVGDISYRQGVESARQFRDNYYPKYAAEYDKQLAMEKRGEKVPREARERLWSMHRRIEQMKREMRAASEREHFDES